MTTEPWAMVWTPRRRAGDGMGIHGSVTAISRLHYHHDSQKHHA
ncbi:MAG: hypothetical protein ACI3Y5_03400 [Prevotella sp.]